MTLTPYEKKLILISFLFLGGCKEPPCLKGHSETVHHPMWIQYITIGKLMSPIIYPEHDSEEFICDEYDTNGSQ